MSTKKKIVSWILFLAFCLLLIVPLFNPNRGSFNHTVFESGRSMTGNEAVLHEIQETNRQCYQNENDPRVQRKNYLFFSVYEVRVNNAKTYRILGLLGTFRVLNP